MLEWMRNGWASGSSWARPPASRRRASPGDRTGGRARRRTRSRPRNACGSGLACDPVRSESPDPWSLLAVATKAGTTFVATYLPAGRAGRVNPTEVMRSE
jgi:hypothetical protein